MGMTTFTGPVTAGNVLNSDGSGNLASAGGDSGTANVGYCEMAQSQVITQAGPLADGVFTTSIVIPAQSQITSIDLLVTTAWSGTAKTAGIGTTVSATYLTAAGSIDGSTATKVSASPGASQVANWQNVGSTDIQVKVTSTNTGSAIGVLVVRYIQSNNI